MAVDLPPFRSSSAVSEPTEVGFSEGLRLLWCCHWPWTLKAEVRELLSRGLSCSLELLWLKSILDKVFLDGGGEGRTLCAMDYKILVLQSTDLSATSLMVAKSEIAEALPKTYFKVSWSVHSRSKWRVSFHSCCKISVTLGVLCNFCWCTLMNQNLDY